MEKKKSSWLKRIMLPAALFASLYFGGCSTPPVKADGPKASQSSFVKKYATKKYSAPAVRTDSKTKEYYPQLKGYAGLKGWTSNDLSRVNASLKGIIVPARDLRIPVYLSGGYYNSEQKDGDILESRLGRIGAGFGGYARLSDFATGYGEIGATIDWTEYINDIDLDITRYCGFGKLGLILRKPDLQILVTGGAGGGEYEGMLGTTQLDDDLTRYFISLKGRLCILGKGTIKEAAGFEDQDTEEAYLENKGKGLYAVFGAAYDEQDFREFFRSRISAAELGLEWRDSLNIQGYDMPYFIRLVGKAREEDYLYPHSDDKMNCYLTGGLEAGIKFCPYAWLVLEGGYDGEHYGYLGVGLQGSVFLPKKKRN